MTKMSEHEVKPDPSESAPNGFTRDYYGILNVAQDATVEEIRAAYRFHLKAFHPDKFVPGSEHARNAQRRTEEILEAYGVLSKPHFRAEYDRFRKYTTPSHDSGGSGMFVPTMRDEPRHRFRDLRNQLRDQFSASTIIWVAIGVLILAALAVWLARTHRIQEGKFFPGKAVHAPTAPAATKAATPSIPSPSPQIVMARETPADSNAEIPSGPSFQISEITTIRNSDSVSEANVELRIGVQARSGIAVDPTKLKIQVFFYDTVNDKQLVLTDADVGYEWLTPHNWKGASIEFLSVKYQRDKKASSDRHVIPPGTHNYLGYLARVYYDDQLQDVRAEPITLVDRFPPPSVAPVEESGSEAFARGEYAIAAQLFKKASDQGDTAAQEKLAWLYETGKGVAQDYRKAVALYEIAAAHGSTVALSNLARMYYEGRGVGRNYAKTAELLDQAAALGSADAMAHLAWLFERGEGVQQNYHVAAAFYQKAVEKGNLRAAVALGVLYELGRGVEQNYTQAADLYQEPAQRGDPEAQTNLANLYSDGKGVTQDYGKAIELLEQAVAQNYPRARVNLGWLYAQGQGVTKDYQKAAELYRIAADQNYAPGQAYLASLYARGRGVPLDYHKAIDLFRAAIVHNDPNSCNDFAWFLATCPDASHRNGKDAVKYAVKACEASRWKDANFIGTLAAAYAEAGDYEKAIDYAKQSLKMPHLRDEEKREMERCLALFKRHRPYHEESNFVVPVTPEQLEGPGTLVAPLIIINVDSATADELNDLAWRLATSPNRFERDGKRAVIYAKKACEISKWGDSHFVSTLAAAHAEAGQFDAAVRYAREALVIERKVSGSGPANFRQRSQMEAFVELFRNKKKYREEQR